MPENTNLPITLEQANKVSVWMKDNFLPSMIAGVTGTKFEVEHIISIACQETAYVFCDWIDKYSPQSILGRLILDASGDVNGTREAFPKNTQAFIDKYGNDFAKDLISEANLTREWRARDWGAKQWVYSGYGIFQNDMQNIQPSPDGYNDVDFFKGKWWYSFDECLKRLMRELNNKYQKTGEIWAAIRAYNGSGSSAMQYAENVSTFFNSIA